MFSKLYTARLMAAVPLGCVVYMDMMSLQLMATPTGGGDSLFLNADRQKIMATQAAEVGRLTRKGFLPSVP